ncbi:GH3 auxin-responsive promoter family protein [Myxococcota bacterium]|nr:GH3 auxin-responsive promoter family protein [Myxococcota bacterium]
MDCAFPLEDSGNGPYRLLRAGRRRLVDQARADLRDPAAAQARRLRAILQASAGSAFGRAHGLDRVRDLAGLQAAVPVRRHAALQPWLDRVEDGERGVLTRDPVRLLVETSGTTGRPKRLPVTGPWEESFAAAQDLWLLGLVRAFEGVTRGRSLALVSAARHGRSRGGLPVGSNTGRILASQPWYVRLRDPVPAAVLALPPELKLYATLRFALPEPVHVLTTANPSTLLLLARRLAQWRAPLSQDLRDGTLRQGPAQALDPRARRALELRLRKVRPPAGAWTPAALWPLAAACCWVDGPAAYFAARLAEALGAPVPVHPVGLTASEGYFAVPLGPGWPGGVLHVGGHVLEVMDESGQARPAHQAEPGERLRLVVSTEAGLLRYDLEDLVEVVGRCEATPMVRFVGKAGRYLNRAGERVSEDQVARAAAAATARHRGPAPTGFTATAVQDPVPWLCVGVEGLPAAALPAWVAAFDEALQQANVEYRGRRATGRMDPPVAQALPEGTYAAWRARRLEAGAPDGQLKDPVIAVDDAEWTAVTGTPVAPRGGP